MLGFALMINLLRGPYESGWIGWGGGWSIKKRNSRTSDGKTVEKSLGLARREKEPEPDGDVEKAGGQSVPIEKDEPGANVSKNETNDAEKTLEETAG